MQRKHYWRRLKYEKEVKKVLDIMAEKYSRTVCERIKEVEKKIMDFKTGEKVDLLIDKFEEMVTEMDALGLLTDRRRYAVSAQFINNQ